MFGQQEDNAADNGLNEPFVGNAYQLLRVRQQRRAHREGNIADEGYVKDMREFEPFVEEEEVQQIRRNPIGIFTVPVYSDYKWIVAITSNANEIAIRCATQFVGQQTEQRPINLLGENPRNGRQRLAVNDVTIHASSLFVWTESVNSRYYIEYANRLSFRAVNAVIPYDKEVFPVLTMGPRDEPIEFTTIKQNLTAHYDFGNYLVYKNAYKERTRELESDVLVMGYPNIPYELRVKSAEGNIRYVQFYLTHGEPDCRILRYIYRVLEISNTVYPYVGIYGGGPLPQSQYRLTWDQPRDVVDKQLVGQQVVGNFRFETDYQKYSDRIGYLCSKDALIYSYERARYGLSTAFLLRDYTFAIMDGHNRNAIMHRQGYLNLNPFHQTVSAYLRQFPLQPKIVICSEGVNALIIDQNDTRADHRYVKFFNSNIDNPAILLDWYSLQADLERSRPHTRRLFRQIMHYRDINDCVHINHNNGQYVFLFSLLSYTVTETIRRPQRLHDNWNMFVLLEGTVTDGYYYLVCQLNTPWIIDDYGDCRLQHVYYKDGPFGNDIDANQFPNFVRHKNFVRKLRQFKPYNAVPQIAQFVCGLSATPRDQFANQGPYTENRFVKINISGLQFVIED